MRCTALTALFFALFALFSTVAYAAPVAPQGEILKRQCEGSGCRDATLTTPGSGSPDRITALTNIVNNLLALMGNNGNTPSNDLQTSTTVTAAQSTSAAPASNPTGTPQYVPTIRWFTEIAIPSPTPLGA